MTERLQLRWENLIARRTNLIIKMASEWDLQNPDEMILGLGYFHGHVRGRIDGFEGCPWLVWHWRKNLEGRRLLKFCVEKELYVANTWFEKKGQRKTTYSVGGYETEIDFVLVGKSNRKCRKDVKVIPWKLQHQLLVTDMVKRK